MDFFRHIRYADVCLELASCVREMRSILYFCPTICFVHLKKNTHGWPVSIPAMLQAESIKQVLNLLSLLVQKYKY